MINQIDKLEFKTLNQTQKQSDRDNHNHKNAFSDKKLTRVKTSKYQPIPNRCIQLNFEDLKPFETLDNQLEEWGVVFENCLVIQPSNPAFPSNSGQKVVMGSPQSGLLEVKFLHCVNWVSALITSSQRLVIYAYDENEELLDQVVLPTTNVANSGSDIPPNAILSLSANDIRKVKFFCLDGHFTLDEFRFCSSS